MSRVNPAWRFLLPLGAVWLLLYGSYALSRPSMPDGPGTVHAEIAREMAARKDWVHPYLNGEPVESGSRALDRTIAVSFRVLGVADWSARLPSALAVLAMAGTLFFFGRRLFESNAGGLYAGLFLLTFPVTFLSTRELSDQPGAALWTTLLAMGGWELLVVRRLPRWTAAVVTAAGLVGGLLLFSWPGVLLPVAIVILAWLVRSQAAAGSRRDWFLLGWALCALLTRNLFNGIESHAMAGLVVMPPLALLLGGWLAAYEAQPDRKSLRVTYVLFACGLAASVAVMLLAIRGVSIAGTIGLSSFHHSLVVAAPGSRAALFVAAAALLAGACGHLWFRLRGQVRIANCFLAGTFGGLLVAILVAMVATSPWSSSQILADAIRPELEPSDLVVVDGRYVDASSLGFYLQRKLFLADGDLSATGRGDRIDLDAAWSGTERVFVWTNAARPTAVPGASYVVAQSGGKMMVSNQPNAAGANF